MVKARFKGRISYLSSFIRFDGWKDWKQQCLHVLSFYAGFRFSWWWFRALSEPLVSFWNCTRFMFWDQLKSFFLFCSLEVGHELVAMHWFSLIPCTYMFFFMWSLRHQSHRLWWTGSLCEPLHLGYNLYWTTNNQHTKY